MSSSHQKINWPADLDVQEDVSLATHTSWLVGGVADYFCEPTSIDALSKIQFLCRQCNVPTTVLGGGTNVLVSDKGVRGMVISLSKLSGIGFVEDDKNFKFWVLSGTNKSELLKIFLKNKLAPARFLAGLPGQVGGGIVMNAGVSENLAPKEFCEIVEEVEVCRPDGRIENIHAKNLKWNYRHCNGWQPGIIARVLISWPNKQDPTIVEDVRKLNQARLSKQPLEWPSCGSVFRNHKPEHASALPQPAGALIERAGLKGHAIGGAQISEKHANFIINRGGAKASDIHALMVLCAQRVKDKFGIDLQSEVVWLGEK